jgi:hypothetical protein
MIEPPPGEVIIQIEAERQANDPYLCKLLDLINSVEEDGPPSTAVLTEAPRSRCQEDQVAGTDAGDSLNLSDVLAGLSSRAQLERGTRRLLGFTTSSRAFSGYVILTWQEGSSEAEVRFFRPWVRIPPRLLLWMARHLGWSPNLSSIWLNWRFRALRILGWKRRGHAR